MAAKKILTLVSDYAEDYETVVPLQTLQMVGHQVHAVCPNKRAGQNVRTVIHDFKGDQTYNERPGHSSILNTDFAQVRAGDYNALLIPGGHAPEYLHLNEQVLVLIRALDAVRKPITAVCRDAQLLAAAGVLQGQACSVYPACAPKVWLADGEYIDILSDQAHVDSHLVTTPAWPAYPAWLARLFEMLGTRISY